VCPSFGARSRSSHSALPAFHRIITREIHAVIAREPIRRGARLISKEFGVRVMQVLGRHWLDYDPVALAVLFVGLGAVSLLAWSI
jgi:hypothetical protein